MPTDSADAGSPGPADPAAGYPGYFEHGMVGAGASEAAGFPGSERSACALLMSGHMGDCLPRRHRRWPKKGGGPRHRAGSVPGRAVLRRHPPRDGVRAHVQGHLVAVHRGRIGVGRVRTGIRGAQVSFAVGVTVTCVTALPPRSRFRGRPAPRRWRRRRASGPPWRVPGRAYARCCSGRTP